MVDNLERETQTLLESVTDQEVQTHQETLTEETQTPDAAEYTTEAAAQTTPPPELLDSQAQTNFVETVENSVQVKSQVQEGETQTKVLELVAVETQVDEVVTTEQETQVEQMPLESSSAQTTPPVLEDGVVQT